jgi:cobalt-zinc-cadmium efflux system protein
MESSGVRTRLAAALGVSIAILVIEAVGGLLSGSLALLADAGHLLSDVGGLLLAYAAARVADRAASRRHTFGLHRAEILAAFVNAQFLLLAAGAIVWTAYRRLAAPPHIRTGGMFFFGVAALAGNLVSVRLLHPHRHGSLNVAGAYLEVFSDALASLAVIAASLLIRARGWLWLDPALSTVIAVFLVPRTVALLLRSAHILLEGAPAEVDQGRIREVVCRLPGVESVHDLHVWTLTSGVHSASLHVAVSPAADPAAVLPSVEETLRCEAGIEHSTIQIEARPATDCESARHD